MCHLNPLFWGQRKTVEAGLFSKPVELDGIKIRVVELLPDAEKLNRVTVPEPAPDKIVSVLGVFVPCNIGDADIILFVLNNYTHFAVEHIDLRHGLSHQHSGISS